MTDEQVLAFIELYNLWNSSELPAISYYGDWTGDWVEVGLGGDSPFLGFIPEIEC